MPASSLTVETFEVGPFPNNLYLLIDSATRAFVVIDPSIESDKAIGRAQVLVSQGYTIQAIWNTHGHVDHVHDNMIWKEQFEVPIWMHEADNFLLEYLKEQSIWLGLPPALPVFPDARFEENQTMPVGSCAARVPCLPGHSPGSVGFYFAQENVIFSGDVLFQNSIGRTDLPGCDFSQLQHSLRRLMALPPQTRVLSGHGAATTIEQELQTNPYLLELKT